MLMLERDFLWWITVLIIHETSTLSFNLPNLPSNATWCENGVTLFDNNTIGGLARGFFVNNNDTIFVAASQKSQILISSRGNIPSLRSISVSLFEYTPLFVTTNGDIYFENGNEAGRIERRGMNSNDSTFVAKFSNHCFGLFVDLNNSLYCSLGHYDRVDKISFDETNPVITTVAGTGSRGNMANKLDSPWGIYVNINYDLYVADSLNNRIQLFRSGESSGITVAGSGTPTGLSLNVPTDVVLDADGYLYIGDAQNARVIQVVPGRWQCVIGCSGTTGSAPNQLVGAYSLHFDRYGNLDVADEHNNRIQKFTLTTNFCDSTATTIPAIDWTTDTPSFGSTAESPQRSTSSVLSVLSTESSTEHFTDSSTESSIAPYYKIWNTACGLLNPCRNNGTCYDSTTSLYEYNCSCSSGFTGSRCEIHKRPCQPFGCWNNGKCVQSSERIFRCQCILGWEGTHCESKENYCRNVTCQNRGVCRPLFRDFKCECLGKNYYSGRYCEIKSTNIIILNTVSKTSGYIAILAILCVVIFVVVMDVLKYCFGIDPTREDKERARRKKSIKKRQPVSRRSVNVNPPLSSGNSRRIIAETTV